ncbi:MAG: hypothetical protein GOMPHAMPRED_005096 [Gomphillus americanus]|uniref:Basic proline-rich protein n=1 Tax=Gomphillus americanus TaxID=1940652 RepID=A0A8H3EIM4_9LECA|nr:MAG: hypothetical protein GOMPHAMPRED_005096 [Gomphillus americanus]
MPPHLDTKEIPSLEGIEKTPRTTILPSINEHDDRPSLLNFETVHDASNPGAREMAPRPPVTRASTEPSSPGSSFGLERLSLGSTRRRTTSPYSRHIRSRSGSSSTPPTMTRAHSSPVVDSFGHVRPTSPYGRPSSPHYSSVRRASPLRYSMEDSSSFSAIDIDETISELDELQLQPRPVASFDYDPASTPLTPNSAFSSSLSRSRRTPPSPLQHFALGFGGHHNLKSSLRSHASSPTLRTFTSPAASPRFNEAFPSQMPYSTSSNASSMPSTPTSFRSRSPSISSLETIPDSPDAEREAIEALERDKGAIAKLKAAIEREGNRRGSSSETFRGRGIFKDSGLSSDKRKRWSVCGAERRSDLDLETIWED